MLGVEEVGQCLGAVVAMDAASGRAQRRNFGFREQSPEPGLLKVIRLVDKHFRQVLFTYFHERLPGHQANAGDVLRVSLGQSPGLLRSAAPHQHELAYRGGVVEQTV
ncbi:hypothetical protein D3C78_1310540 [compost metagenome]